MYCLKLYNGLMYLDFKGVFDTFDEAQEELKKSMEEYAQGNKENEEIFLFNSRIEEVETEDFTRMVSTTKSETFNFIKKETLYEVYKNIDKEKLAMKVYEYGSQTPCITISCLTGEIDVSSAPFDNNIGEILLGEPVVNYYEIKDEYYDPISKKELEKTVSNWNELDEDEKNQMIADKGCELYPSEGYFKFFNEKVSDNLLDDEEYIKERFEKMYIK